MHHSAVKTLAKHIQENIPEIKKVYDFWPSSKDKMDLPSITLLANKRPVTSYPPELLKTSDNPENPDLIDSVYLIGHFDYTIQLDLWCDTKSERQKMEKKVEDLFTQNFSENEGQLGIELTLHDNDDVIARYDNVGYDYFDDGESSSLSEYRVKFEILVSHPKVIKKTESRMSEIILEQHPTEYNDFNESNLDIEEI